VAVLAALCLQEKERQAAEAHWRRLECSIHLLGQRLSAVRAAQQAAAAASQEPGGGGGGGIMTGLTIDAEEATALQVCWQAWYCHVHVLVQLASGSTCIVSCCCHMFMSSLDDGRLERCLEGFPAGHTQARGAKHT
jgi:hypothetical protein